MRDGPKFTALSDTDWSSVWRHVVAASDEAPLPEPARTREMVDGAALSSGFFFDYVVMSINKQDYTRFSQEGRVFLEKLESFALAAKKFFGEPDDDPNDPYDPWPERKILEELENLNFLVRKRIALNEHYTQVSTSMPPNSAKPERDLWMARLMLVWCEECQLPSNNSKNLRGFLSDALRPYKTGITDRGAEQFIERWNRGKIERPKPAPFGLFDR